MHHIPQKIYLNELCWVDQLMFVKTVNTVVDLNFLIKYDEFLVFMFK